MSEQTWTVKAPADVSWSPSELGQIGGALQELQAALPGVCPVVVLEGVTILPNHLRRAGGWCAPTAEALRGELEPHLRAHERSNSSTMCVCGDMQAGAADPLAALNAFAPHVDRKTGQPCPGIPLPGWPAS